MIIICIDYLHINRKTRARENCEYLCTKGVFEKWKRRCVNNRRKPPVQTANNYDVFAYRMKWKKYMIIGNMMWTCNLLIAVECTLTLDREPLRAVKSSTADVILPKHIKLMLVSFRLINYICGCQPFRFGKSSNSYLMKFANFYIRVSKFRVGISIFF